jgi:hypothetical protein
MHFMAVGIRSAFDADSQPCAGAGIKQVLRRSLADPILRGSILDLIKSSPEARVVSC